MSEIVSQVHSLAAAAAGVLPRAGTVGRLAEAEALALLGELSSLRREVDTAISLVAADIERKSARELGAQSMARKAGLKSGAELVQKLTGSSLGDAKKAVRVGVLLEAAASVVPAGGSGDAGDAGAGADPGPRSIAALAALGDAWDAPVAVAVRNGWLPAEHADRMLTGLGQPRDAESASRWREAALSLIGDCWGGELTAEDVGRSAKATRAGLDREWAAGNAQRLYEQRSLKRSVRGDGMVKYDLLVDPLTDAQLWTPIFRHVAPRLGGPRFLTEEERQHAAELERDARTNEQLLADTFTGFLTAGVGADVGAGSTGSTGSTASGRYTPTVTIAVTTGELKKAMACPADGPDGLAWLDGKPEPLSGPQLLAALCDGAIAGLLLDESGQALDATKAERTFSLRQRRALAIRDGGCLIPGCTMPPSACEVHHINPWSERAANHRTETRDGVLLCRFHHLNLHNQGGRVERRGSSYWLHWPGREPARLVPKHGLLAQLRHEGALA